MTITIAQTVPADADSDHLLGYLNAAPGWQYVLSFGKGEYWATTYQRTEGPFAGYKIDVPQHDEDPQWCPQVAEIINGVERGQMPACGLSSARISRAVAAINAVCQPGRTGRATLSEAVALRDILDPWYTVTPDARHILRTIANGRPVHVLTPQSVALLQVLAARLASLLVVEKLTPAASTIVKTVPAKGGLLGYQVHAIREGAPLPGGQRIARVADYGSDTNLLVVDCHGRERYVHRQAEIRELDSGKVRVVEPEHAGWAAD